MVEVIYNYFCLNIGSFNLLDYVFPSITKVRNKVRSLYVTLRLCNCFEVNNLALSMKLNNISIVYAHRLTSSVNMTVDVY